MPNLQRVRTPAFRRTPVPVAPSCVPALVRRYQQAALALARIHYEGKAAAAADGWFCRASY